MATNKNDRHGGDTHTSPPHLRLKGRPNGIEAAIGKKMRAMYDELLHQPVPERFVELLKRIDQARENKS
jgi:Anti-sigma factor NepR